MFPFSCRECELIVYRDTKVIDPGPGFEGTECETILTTYSRRCFSVCLNFLPVYHAYDILFVIEKFFSLFP